MLLELKEIDAVDQRHLEYKALTCTLAGCSTLVLCHGGASATWHLIWGSNTVAESAVNLREVPVVFPQLLEHPFLIKYVLDLLLLLNELLGDNFQCVDFAGGSMGSLNDFALMALAYQSCDLEVREGLLLFLVFLSSFGLWEQRTQLVCLYGWVVPVSRVIVLMNNRDFLFVFIASNVDVAVLEVAVLNDQILHHDLSLALLPLGAICSASSGLGGLWPRCGRLTRLTSTICGAVPAWVFRYRGGREIYGASTWFCRSVGGGKTRSC